VGTIYDARELPGVSTAGQEWTGCYSTSLDAYYQIERNWKLVVAITCLLFVKCRYHFFVKSKITSVLEDYLDNNKKQK
jgi:hypothetical protein